jgi:hypothetical protein
VVAQVWKDRETPQENPLGFHIGPGAGGRLLAVGRDRNPCWCCTQPLLTGRGPKPVLNVISSVLPIGLAISFAKQAITGTGTAVGVTDVEIDVTDGSTGQRVAAAVDSRAGTKAWRTKFQGSWGDAKLG